MCWLDRVRWCAKESVLAPACRAAAEMVFPWRPQICQRNCIRGSEINSTGFGPGQNQSNNQPSIKGQRAELPCAADGPGEKDHAERQKKDAKQGKEFDFPRQSARSGGLQQRQPHSYKRMSKR